MTLALRATNDGGGIILLNGSPKITLDAAGNIVGTLTPSKFSADKKLPTTEFVQKALGSFSDCRPLGSATVMDASYAGGAYALTASGAQGMSVTLPPVLGLPDGACILLKCTTAPAFVPINTAGSDLITFAPGIASSTFNLDVGEDATLVKMGTAWIITGLTVFRRLPYMLTSLGMPGYQKLPSGLIMQWGMASIPAGQRSVGAPLPIVFPNQGITALAIDNGQASYFAGVSAVSTSAVAVWINVVAATTVNIRWFALGY